MFFGQLAFFAAAVFSGAALYVSAVEQPARLQLDPGSMLREWKPAYKRGTAMQVPLLVASFLFGLIAWAQTGRWGFLLGALLMITNLPFTIFVIMPTNKWLMAADPATASLETRTLLKQWGRLHAVRTALGFAAAAAFLWALHL